MNKIFTLSFTLFFVAISSFAQNKKDILLTIDDNVVLAKEFTRVYKKNLDLVQEESQKSVDGYLQLFIDYKLKVAEAYSQGFQDSKSYKEDFAKYEEQLSRNYIFEDKVTSELAREAYDRTLEEIDASHILVMVTYDAVPQDTLKAYNKLKAVRDRAIKGEDFATLAKENSEEPNIEKSEGHLGYFTAFALVYPFETAAYNTEAGKVSKIVRTQFGYHIIKVHDRRKKASEITVSHIMISTKDTTKSYTPKERIQEIYALIQQGDSFESLAKQYSDDKNSGKNGGKLRKFSKGDLRSSSFEEAAYKLENLGDMTEPVLSDFGWHIIRLDEKHSLPTYKEKKDMLERRVKEGSRSKIVTNAVNKKIREKYGYIKGESYSPYFDTYVATEVLGRRWKMDTIPASEDKRMFNIGDHKVFFKDFAKYVSERQMKSKQYKSKITLLADYYDEFETLELKTYFRGKLELENEEYAGIISEYRDGLLIFDVMGKNIWSKAKRDTIGQQKYFEENRSKYQWKQRFNVEIIGTSKQNVSKQVEALFKEGKSGDEIKTQLNVDKKVNVLLTKGVFEFGERELPTNFKPQLGLSKIYTENDSFIILKVNEIIASGPKEFDEIKGRVLSDYQGYVEKTWIEELRAKYKVEINQKTLRRLKKELKL
ncbi:MAG: peptidylprolyl isomerase [Flavobacteriaceae bacterium]|nr:peptidylprolyl isomerase [Flavobacteriaceae bacterium]